jgi:hypothetical protein
MVPFAFMKTRWTAALVASATLFAACPPSEEKPPEPDLTRAKPPAVKLSGLPLVAAPGAALSPTVSVSGDFEGLTLHVRVTPPGLVAKSFGDDEYVKPGLPLPTGAAKYLGADGAWVDQSQALPLEAPEQTLAFSLPNMTVGKHRVQVLLQADDRVVAADSADVLVHVGAALSLSVNTISLSTTDPYTARVRAARGSQPTKLYAWLRHPDGTQVDLPGQGPLDVPDEGLELDLLRQRFDGLPEGAYTLEVRLLENDDTLAAMASAGFTVCAAPVTVSGRLLDATGAARVGTLSARRVDSPREVISGLATDAAGNFQLELRAGPWSLEARFSDEQGLHRSDVPVAVMAACATPVTAVEVRTAPPIAGLGTTSRGLGRQQALTGAGQNQIRISVRHSENNGEPDRVTRRLFADHIAEFLNDRTREAEDILWTSSLDDQSALAALAYAQTMNVEPAGLAASSVGDADFVLFCTFRRSRPEGPVFVQFQLVDVREITVINSQSFLFPEDAPIETSYETAANRAIETFATPVNSSTPPLRPWLEGFMNFPSTPELSVRAEGLSAPPGARVNVTVSLVDKGGGKPAREGTPVRLVGRNNSGNSSLEVCDLSLTLGATATATGQCSVGTREGLALYTAIYERDRTEWKAVDSVSVQSDQKPTVQAEKTRLKPQEETNVVVVLAPGGAPKPSAKLTVSTNAGTLAPESVTTGSDGSARVKFTAPNGPRGIAIRAEEENTVDKQGAGSLYVEAPLVVTVDAEPRSSLIVGTTVEVVALVTTPSGPLPNAMVFFTLTGQGTLSATRVDADQNGVARVTYTAPAMGNGGATVNARSFLGENRASGNVLLDFHTPCMGCPLTINSNVVDNSSSVPKNTNERFVSNQIVTWTTEAPATISSNGVFRSAVGGAFKVTATSSEQAGTTATKTIYVDCDVDEMKGVYSGNQTILFNDGMRFSCSTPGTKGRLTLSPLIDTPDGGFPGPVVPIAMAWESFDPGDAVCDQWSSPANFGLHPRAQGCKIYYRYWPGLAPCRYDEATLVPKSPKIAGWTGDFRRSLGTQPCTDNLWIGFDLDRAP